MADTEEGWSILHHAVAGRFTKLIQTLLEKGAEEIVNTPDGQGRTPLHLACADVKGDVPLFLKCESEDVSCRTFTETEQVIELLLSYGADPQILDSRGNSPLHCLIGHWLVKEYPVDAIGKIITQFLHCRGDINIKDGNGRTLLHYVAGSPEIEVPVAKPLRDEVRSIRQRGILQIPIAPIAIVPVPIPIQHNVIRVDHEEHEQANVNRAEPSNDLKFTPGQERFYKQFLLKLLSFGADMSIADNKGNTPLHVAIAAGKFEIVKELLKGESNVNVQNIKGQTPLHLAAADREKFKNCNCAITLMHKGALASIKDFRNHTPVDIIRDRKDFPCFLKHLILLIHAKMHPEMDISARLNPYQKTLVKECILECENLNLYFELHGKSQLPIFLQYHSLPSYTNNDFFQTKINCDCLYKNFPIYCTFLKYKFSQDQTRREMIDKCTNVFSCFGGTFQYTTTGRLMYTRNLHWEALPIELKLKILSYLGKDDLEHLKKHLLG